MKIMIVEDEAELLELYKAALPHDWTIDCYLDSHEAAMKYTSTSGYDLVVTDLKMACKNGEGLIFDIKYINPEQKVIVISGHSEELHVPEKFHIKVFDKPWDIRNIIPILQSWQD